MPTSASLRAVAATAATLGLLALSPMGAASAATGDVLTFGANTFGQLGNGTVGSTPRPTPTKVLGSATDVAGGRQHVLALVGGRVWAWGDDTKGAVGNGGAYSSAVTTPTQLTSAMSGVDSVATGHYHSMALDKDSHTVWAWGWNSRGQIGPAGGTAGKIAAPVKVALPAGNVTTIAAGRAHSLALVGGKVYAWGDNGNGQLGRAADTARHSTPTLVSGLPSGVTWIAGGRDSSFAIAGGALYAWGNNQYGQLGIGSTASTSTPRKVSLTGTVKEVESGADHTVALLTSGAVYAWGRNEYGQVGVSGGSNHTSPARVTGLPSISQVRVGRDHSLAIDGSGNLYAWGRNDGGQLGVSPSTVSRTSTPRKVTSAGLVKDAGGGQVYTVALKR